MKLLPVIPDNQRPDLCAPCGGQCCASAPGGYFPADFGATEAEIRATVRVGLLDGTLALSDYEDAFVRPPIRDREGVVQPAWSYFKNLSLNPCANLTMAGCSLAFERRPTQCRALLPDPIERGGKGCKLPAEVENDVCRQAWAPYADLFLELGGTEPDEDYDQ